MRYLRKSKKILIVLSILIVVLTGLYGCRRSPVLQQVIYNQDALDVDDGNQAKNNNKNNLDEDEKLSSKKEKDDADTSRDREKKDGIQKDNGEDTSGSDVRYDNTADSNLEAGGMPGQDNNTVSTGTGTEQRNEQGSSPNGSNHKRGDKGTTKQILDGNRNYVEVPENVKTVTAVGNAAAIVEMLGGSGRLAGTSEDFKTNSWVSKIFGSGYISSIPAFWANDGSSTISTANFNELLDLYPDVCFEISGQSTLNDSQIKELEDIGMYYVVLPVLNSKENIKWAVEIVAEVLGDKSGEGGTNAPSIAQKYKSFVGNSVSIAGNSAGSSKYSLFISGWDSSAQYALSGSNGVDISGSGAAVVKSRSGTMVLNDYMKIAGVTNTSSLNEYSDHGQEKNWYISPFYPSSRSLSIDGNAGFYPGKEYKLTKSENGIFLGTEGFMDVIVDSGSTRQGMLNDLMWQFHDKKRSLVSGLEDYAIFDSEGGLIPSNIHGNYEIYVNPTGVDSWTDGTVESILEPLWIAHKFGNYEIGSLKQKIKEFYKEFYRYDLNDSEVSAILNGN